ncbi:hypothetical protein [Cupriavidus necator]
MKTKRYALIAVATLAAALSAAPAFAKNGKFDVFTDGAKFDVYSDGAKTGKFDAFTDGARAGKFNAFTDGAKYETTSDRAPL